MPPRRRPPLLIGEAPSRSSDPALPFSGRSGARLEALLGRPLGDVFELRNLLDEWPGPSPYGKGAKFFLPAARERAAEILGEWERGRLLVLVGKRVARAFALDYPYLEVVGVRHPSVVIPHPSGVNRWWNDPANVARARDFLRSLV